MSLYAVWHLILNVPLVGLLSVLMAIPGNTLIFYISCERICILRSRSQSRITFNWLLLIRCLRKLFVMENAKYPAIKKYIFTVSR